MQSTFSLTVMLETLEISFFGIDYDIYSARSFCFDEMENGEDEDVIHRNLVRAYLQDALLGYEFVMIDLG